jgi:hypothetical protein
MFFQRQVTHGKGCFQKMMFMIDGAGVIYDDHDEEEDEEDEYKHDHWRSLFGRNPSL